MNDQNIYKIRISPDVIKKDIFQETYSGGTASIYYSMPKILSGGTNGSSLLTGLTIPIFLNQTIHDIGVYSEFDGDIIQEDDVTNFVISTNPATPYVVTITNSSDQFYKKYLNQTYFIINWGDATPAQTINTFSPNVITHTYPGLATNYTVSFSAFSPWGTSVISRRIVTPFTNVTIPNPQGTYNLNPPSGGNFSAYPTTYNFIFNGDGLNTVAQQTSNNFTAVPFAITGITVSRVNTLAQYGTTKFRTGIQVTGVSDTIGTYYGPTGSGIISYRIDGVNYYDYPNGTTTFRIFSRGFTTEMLTEVPIVKDESLMSVVMEPEVQSSIFIERGKTAALERIQRIGEVDNIGDIEKYGYSFFNVKTYN